MKNKGKLGVALVLAALIVFSSVSYIIYAEEAELEEISNNKVISNQNLVNK